MTVAPGLEVSLERLSEVCRRYEVNRLSLFGSVARGESTPESDADILVEYRPGHHQSLFSFSELQEELERLLGRRVDLVSRDGLSPHLRSRILQEAREFYAAE